MRIHYQNILFSVFASLVFSSSAVALTFHNPWTKAKVLNHGQSHWGIDTTYESSRKIESAPHTQVSNTWGQLLKNSKNAQASAQIESQRIAAGQSLTDKAAVTQYELYQETATMNIGWSYGIYKNWMIGFDIPLVATNHKIRSQTTGQETSEVQAAAAESLNEVGIRADRTEYSEQRLGDVALLSQVQLASYKNWIFAFQQRVGIPTAAPADERNLFMSRVGNGQPSLGGRLLASWQQSRRWQVNASTGYLWQVRDEVRIRLPDSDGNVSGDIETGVSRDLGDVYDAQLEGVWRTGGVDWVAGYRILHKQADRYQGSFVDQTRYEELGQNSAWTRQLISAGALYHIGTQRAGVRDGYSVLVAGHWPLQEQGPLWSLDLRMMF